MFTHLSHLKYLNEVKNKISLRHYSFNKEKNSTTAFIIQINVHDHSLRFTDVKHTLNYASRIMLALCRLTLCDTFPILENLLEK